MDFRAEAELMTERNWTDRNAQFAANQFRGDLRMMPSVKTIVIGCVDPRVDPADVLGLAQGEVAVIRNVGGRVTPEALVQLAILRSVTRAAGADLGQGWEILILQHTDCGITRLADQPDLLAPYLGVELEQVESMAVGDPHAAVVLDAAAIRNDPRIPGVSVSGLVYDVATGLVSSVVAA